MGILSKELGNDCGHWELVGFRRRNNVNFEDCFFLLMKTKGKMLFIPGNMEAGTSPHFWQALIAYKMRSVK